MRTFSNPNNLSSTVTRLRLRKLDPLAEARVETSATEGRGGSETYVALTSSLSDAEIDTALAGPVTAAETQAIKNYQEAAQGFEALPDWATWTPAQAADYIHAQVLASQDETQVQAWIDVNVTTLATAKDALKMLAVGLVRSRNIQENISRAVLYLRNLVVSLRR